MLLDLSVPVHSCFSNASATCWTRQDFLMHFCIHADFFVQHASGQTPSGAMHVYQESLRSSIFNVLVIRRRNV